MFTGSYSQNSPRKLELNSAIGVNFFEKRLAFQGSPSFGLGAGYHITELLQLNLAFSFIPTQQRISTATEKVIAKYSVYIYVIGLRFSPRKPVLWILSPFVEMGAGGIIIDPHAVLLDLGAGNVMQFEAQVDHNTSVNFGGGVMIPLSERIRIKLAYQHSLYRLTLADGSNRETITAQNRFGGLSLSVSF